MLGAQLQAPKLENFSPRLLYQGTRTDSISNKNLILHWCTLCCHLHMCREDVHHYHSDLHSPCSCVNDDTSCKAVDNLCIIVSQKASYNHNSIVWVSQCSSIFNFLVTEKYITAISLLSAGSELDFNKYGTFQHQYQKMAQYPHKVIHSSSNYTQSTSHM